jgi:hypothetical protein
MPKLSATNDYTPTRSATTNLQQQTQTNPNDKSVRTP